MTKKQQLIAEVQEIQQYSSLTMNTLNYFLDNISEELLNKLSVQEVSGDKFIIFKCENEKYQLQLVSIFNNKAMIVSTSSQEDLPQTKLLSVKSDLQEIISLIS